MLGDTAPTAPCAEVVIAFTVVLELAEPCFIISPVRVAAFFNVVIVDNIAFKVVPAVETLAGTVGATASTLHALPTSALRMLLNCL
jgi:hypothetical protein